MLAPQLGHPVIRDRNPLRAGDVGRHLPTGPVRQTSPGRRAHPGQRQHPRPDPGRHLLPRPTRPLTEQTSGTLGRVPAQPQVHRRTRHTGQPRDALFSRPSAYHNTIRARVPTAATTSPLLINARSSTNSSAVNSSRPPPSRRHNRITGTSRRPKRTGPRWERRRVPRRRHTAKRDPRESDCARFATRRSRARCRSSCSGGS